MAQPRTALVTGANRGIGLAVAQALGRQGLTVIVGARDYGRIVNLSSGWGQAISDRQPRYSVLLRGQIATAVGSLTPS